MTNNGQTPGGNTTTAGAVEQLAMARRIAETPPPDDKTLPTLRRAFVERGADFITLDGWSGAARWADVRWATQVGIIFECPATSQANSDEQYTAVCFRMTEHGANHLKGPQP